MNQRARAILKRRGELGAEVKVETWREVTRDDGSLASEPAERIFAPGDRVMFLKNDRELGVKNGSVGTEMSVNIDSMQVILDGKHERQVTFELRNYAAIDHGYAATVHKAQGVTVDRVSVLATPGMDRLLSYVSMTGIFAARIARARCPPLAPFDYVVVAVAANHDQLFLA